MAVALRQSSGRTAKCLKLDTQKSVRGEALEP
jgi:hypothetical protein